MNRTKRFLYNTVATAFFQIVTMLSGFVVPWVMLRFYGSELNGLVASITQFMTYFTLIEAGLSSAAIYALYKPLADNDIKGINGIVSATKKFYSQAGLIFAGLVCLLAVLYPFFINSSTIKSLDVFLLVIILGANGVLEFFTLSKYRVILNADQKIYVISLASCVYVFLNVGIIVAFSYIGVNIVILRAFATIAIFARSILLMIYCKKKYPYLDYNEVPNKLALKKRWDALYQQVQGVVQAGAPILILTLVVRDLMLVSVYAVFNIIISGIIAILSIFTNGLYSSFGDIIIRGDTNKLKKVYGEFEYGYYIIITVIYCVAFMLTMSFINIYTKGIVDVNYNRPIIGFLFCLNGLLQNLKTPQAMLVVAAGMYKETRWQNTIQCLLAVILGVIFAILWGIEGVIIASIIANLYRVIDLMIFCPNNITKTKKLVTLRRVIRCVCTCAILFAVYNLFSFNPTNYLQWVLLASIITIIVSIIVIILNGVLEFKILKKIWSRLKSL